MVLYLLIKEKNLKLFLNVLFLGVIVLLYNPNFTRIRFRSISVLKIFVISFVWSYSTLCVGNTVPISTVEFLFVFLFIYYRDNHTF
jgi:hypothetical protein